MVDGETPTHQPLPVIPPAVSPAPPMQLPAPPKQPVIQPTQPIQPGPMPYLN